MTGDDGEAMGIDGEGEVGSSVGIIGDEEGMKRGAEGVA